MVSARAGGIAVALGIGYAVAAGAGVASADPSDGSSGADSSASSPSSASSSASSASSASTSASTSESGSSSDSPSTGVAPSPNATESATTIVGTERDDGAAAATPADTGDAADPADDRKKPTTAPHERTAPGVKAPADDTDTVSVTGSSPAEPAAALPQPATGSPAAPTDSPATWAMAAAARRELTTPEADPAEQEVTQFAAAAEVPAVNRVTAVEQIAPLEFLQHLPVLGPVVITPIVAVLHQIPVVGDVLHPYIGYPVQWGLPPGAPRPRDVRVISSDGTSIYVHFMPSTTFDADGRAPTVLNGPGLGLPGATNIDGTFLDPILADTVGMLSPGTLRRAGYNVVTWDPRGEWNSGGTLELNAAEFEARDMSAIISWIATQPEARLDAAGDPRLGMVGVSYGGGIQLVTAANDTRVDAIVPAITYNRLNSSLYKAGAFKTSWATPLTAVLTILGGRINPRIVPATLYGDLTGELSPSDLALFLSRNPAIEKILVPTLIIHGTVDNLFSLAEADATAQTLLANGVPTKVVWFCGGHGVCANNLFDFSDGALIEQRTLAWLDRYVKLDTTAVTGPQFEWVDQRGQWFSSATYPTEASSSVVATAAGQSTLPLIPYLGGSGFPFVPYALPALNAVNLTVGGGDAITHLVGAPTLSLTYSGTGTAEHVYAQLVDNSTGLVLGAIVTPIPVVLDGDTHTIEIDLEPVSHTLRPGESLTLQIVSSAGLYETVLPSTGTLTVTDVRVSLPTANPTVAAAS